MKKKFFFHKWKKNTAVSGILLLLQLLVLVFFLLQYTVSYSEDFFSRCEDFFPKQLSKTCGSYENTFFGCQSTLLHAITNFKIEAIFCNLGSTKTCVRQSIWRYQGCGFFFPCQGKKIFFFLGKEKNIFVSLARKPRDLFPWESLQCRTSPVPQRGHPN